MVDNVKVFEGRSRKWRKKIKRISFFSNKYKI